jgi:hypothetical protein
MAMTEPRRGANPDASVKGGMLAAAGGASATVGLRAMPQATRR